MIGQIWLNFFQLLEVEVRWVLQFTIFTKRSYVKFKEYIEHILNIPQLFVCS